MESAASRTYAANEESVAENTTNKYKTSTVPVTIITCPACRTRFAVGTNVIAEVPDPRFHCSRCDSLFSLSELPLLREEPTVEIPVSEAKETVRQEIPTFKSVQAESLPQPQISINIPQKTELLSVNDFSLRTPGTFESKSIEDHFSTEADSIAFPLPTKDSLRARKPAKQKNLSSDTRSEWYGCWFFLSILLAALTLLSVVTYIVGLEPIGASKIITLPVPGILEPQSALPPPSELVIARSKFDMIELESGEKIPALYARLANTGSDRFSWVEVEGLLFDAKGRVVASERAPLRSALGREKIPSLDLETIGRFQNSVAGKASNIDSKQRVDFVITFPTLARKAGEQSTLSPRSYSVRVYQVRH